MKFLESLAVKFGTMLGNFARNRRQSMCQHDYHWEFDRVRSHTFLRCQLCGHTTPGWSNADIKPPRVIYPKADERYSAGSSK